MPQSFLERRDFSIGGVPVLQDRPGCLSRRGRRSRPRVYPRGSRAALVRQGQIGGGGGLLLRLKGPRSKRVAPVKPPGCIPGALERLEPHLSPTSLPSTLCCPLSSAHRIGHPHPCPPCALSRWSCDRERGGYVAWEPPRPKSTGFAPLHACTPTPTRAPSPPVCRGTVRRLSAPRPMAILTADRNPHRVQRIGFWQCCEHRSASQPSGHFAPLVSW